MQILPLSSNFYNKNNTKLTNFSNSSAVNFQAKRELVGITADSFKSETAKNLYSKIQKYLRLIGKEGSVKNIKLYKENSRYYLSKPRFFNYFDSDAEIFLSIERNNKKINMNLSRKYSEPTMNTEVLLNATFNEKGQMVRAQFPPEDLYFERKNQNLRKMHRYDNVYSPVGGNDREWNCNGGRIPDYTAAKYDRDDSSLAVYEMFIELARLKTSIIK